eukprot:SAG22_NODE_2201_length_2844_cov_1.754098_1_plen_741_part_00
MASAAAAAFEEVDLSLGAGSSEPPKPPVPVPVVHVRRTSASSIRRRRTSGHAAPGGAPPVATDEGIEAPYEFPTWWFVALRAHSFPMSIIEGVLWGLIWPKQIAEQFGNAEKVKVLGGLASLSTVLQWLMPLFGDLSDRDWPWTRWCAGRDGEGAWCRRRPFVLAAHLWWTGSIALTWYGLSTKNLPLMVGSCVVGAVGQLLGDPNWGAYPAETIPASQRGTFLAVQAQVGVVFGVLSGFVGIAVGEGLLEKYFWGENTIWVAAPTLAYQVSHTTSCLELVAPPLGCESDAYLCVLPKQQAAVILVDLVRPPFMMCAFNGTAGCPLKTCLMTREVKLRKRALVDGHDHDHDGANEADAGADDDRKDGDAPVTPSTSPTIPAPSPSAEPATLATAARRPAPAAPPAGGCCQQAADWALGFFSAFTEDSAFRYLWLYSFIGSVAGGFSGTFGFYFMQDAFVDVPGCVASDCARSYSIFGTVITTSTQTALSILGLISSIISGTVVWSGGWWRTRFGGRQMVFFTSVIPTAIEPLTYAIWPGHFAINTAWTVSDSLTGSIASASGGALGMDCLPTGPDGRPKNAGRDQALQGQAGRIPGAVMPIALAGLLGFFPTHLLGYRWFFAVAALLGALQLAVLALLVHPLEERLDRPLQCTRHWFRADHDNKRRRRRSSAIDMLNLGRAAVLGEDGDGPSWEDGGLAAGAGYLDRMLFGADYVDRKGQEWDGVAGRAEESVAEFVAEQ